MARGRPAPWHMDTRGKAVGMTGSGRKRTLGLVASVAMAAAVMGVTGCSSDGDSGDKSGDKKPAESSSAGQDSGGKSDDGGKNDQQGGGGSGIGGGPQVKQSSPQEAVASWVGAIVKGKPKEACLVMAEPAKGSAPAKVGSPERCNSGAPDVQKMQKGVGRFREAFSPKPPSDNPKVEAAQVPANGGKAVIPADKVTVDGKSLDKIIVSNSTGVKEDQLDVKFTSAKIKDAWYVTDFAFNIG